MKNNVQMKGSTTMKNNVEFINGSKTTEQKPYAPYNYKWLLESKVGAVNLKIGTVSYDPKAHKPIKKLVGYEIVPIEIKELVKDPVYTGFDINGYNLKDAFNLVAKLYKSKSVKDVEKAKRLYIRLNEAVQEYNAEYTAELSANMDFRLHRDAYQELGANFGFRNEHQYRWDELLDALPNEDPNQLKAKFDKLSELDRQLLLMRASDYGLTPFSTDIHRKDVYTMRIAPVAHEADDVHPWNIYHKTTESDPVKTFVGRYTDTVVLKESEDEVMAAAVWFSQYGDEFMEKCKPLYDIVRVEEYTEEETLYDLDNVTPVETVTMYKYRTEVLYTGTAEQCELLLDQYKATHGPKCTILHSDKEITVREARLLGASEEDFVEFRDFRYDGKDIWD